MKFNQRFRRLFLVATSLVLLLLAALSIGKRSRGVSYYFPNWVGSD